MILIGYTAVKVNRTEFYFADKNTADTTLKTSDTVKEESKEIESGSQYYQGVYISREVLIGYLETVFEKEGLKDRISEAKRVISCESGFQVDPPHNNSCRGVAQFKEATFSAYCKGDLMNPFRQLDCMAKLWRERHENWWECYTMYY